MNAIDYPFVRSLGRAINSGQSRSVVVSGNIEDLFFLPDDTDAGGTYVPLVDLLAAAWRDVAGIILVRYELNGPIRFERESDRALLRDAWVRWRTSTTTDAAMIANLERRRGAEGVVRSVERAAQDFDEHCAAAIGQPTRALEFLRQLCCCSRATVDGAPCLSGRLCIIIEGADLIVPESAEIARLAVDDRRRMVICRDWFSDPGFVNGKDTVLLIAESRSQIHHRVARMPQVIEVAVPAPSTAERALFATWFLAQLGDRQRPKLWGSIEALAENTAGLTIHALRQLLVDAAYDQRELTIRDVTVKVEEFLISQLGDGTIEFLRPEHRLDMLVGNTRLIAFIRKILIPRFQRTDRYALPGAAISGPIGAGKSYIFEAVAAEIGCPVLVLKEIRSKWLGETDVIFERLRRVIQALAKVVIFVDEADTQFGSVGEGTHETERRLTGKIQAMMADPKLRGKVHWLLMTARIYLLSPDIRRPGRVGNLIIPVFVPEGPDRTAFLQWTIASFVRPDACTDDFWSRVDTQTQGYSAAAFAALREELGAAAGGVPLDADRAAAIVSDVIPADIGATCRYQELQAVINCTRRSLLPTWFIEDRRSEILDELRQLEQEGIK